MDLSKASSCRLCRLLNLSAGSSRSSSAAAPSSSDQPPFPLILRRSESNSKEKGRRSNGLATLAAPTTLLRHCRQAVRCPATPRREGVLIKPDPDRRSSPAWRSRARGYVKSSAVRTPGGRFRCSSADLGHNLPPSFRVYFDLRRYCSVPHGVFGMGVDASWLVCVLEPCPRTDPLPSCYGCIHDGTPKITNAEESLYKRASCLVSRGFCP